MNFKTYWFEFESSDSISLPPGIGIGCGVSAYNYYDAMRIISDKIFRGEEIPPVKKMIEDVKINQLDHGHVVPNMKSMIFYGIWFPLGYE